MKGRWNNLTVAERAQLREVCGKPWADMGNQMIVKKLLAKLNQQQALLKQVAEGIVHGAATDKD